MDLIRELMLRLEAYPMGVGGVHHFQADDEELAVPGYSYNEIDHHLMMIVRAGFVETAADAPLSGGILFQSLTWPGQDFVDSVRDPEIWAMTKQGIEKAKGFTVELMVELAKGLVKTQIKRVTGIDL